jgi:hypothetical protein
MNTNNSEHKAILLHKICSCIIFAIVAFSCAYLWNVFFASSRVPATITSTQNVSIVQKTKLKYKHTRIADIKVGDRVVTSESKLLGQLDFDEIRNYTNTHNSITNFERTNEIRQKYNSINNGKLLCYPKNEVIDDSIVLSICNDIIINVSCDNINCSKHSILCTN